MTPPPPARQKVYCYVDETGQDTTSRSFIVVAVASLNEQERLRDALLQVEQSAGSGNRKWHKARPARRLHYLSLVLELGIGSGEVFFGSYPKPIPFFFPMLEVLEHAIKAQVSQSHTARVFVDGIDRQKASELTNARRVRGISLGMVRSRRDESEPLIRLADMWAGCIRAALANSREERALFERALMAGYLRRVK